MNNSKKIVIQWSRGFGNNLFQYNYARNLNPKGDRIYSHYKNGWQCFNNLVELGFLEENKAPKIKEDSKIDNLIQWNSKSFFKPYLFKQSPKKYFKKVEVSNEKDLILHLRLGDDWLRKNRILSPENYIDLIDSINFEKLYIVTDVHDSDFLKNFKKYNHEVVSTETRPASFKTGTWTYDNKKTTVSDFNLIRGFDKIIYSPQSTYGFWACLLSNAKEIYSLEKYIKAKNNSLINIINNNKKLFKNWKLVH